MFNVILFDLDGTICDTNQLILESLRCVLSSVNIADLSDTNLLMHWGKPLEYQLHQFLPGRDDYDELTKKYREFYRDNQSIYLKEFTGIREMLVKLAETEKVMGIVTSKYTIFATETLDAMDYSKFFQFVIGCDQVAKVKPNPEAILKALNITGNKNAESIYIGDNTDDIIAAKRSSISSAVVGWSLTNKTILLNESPDFFFETPDDILKISG